MEAKAEPYIYTKGNKLEVVFIDKDDGIKIALSNPQRESEHLAVMLPLELLEPFICYLIGMAKFTGIKVSYGKDCKMRALDVTESKVKKFDEIENKALAILSKVLSEEREVDSVAKMAIQSLNVVAKNRQTLTNRQSIGWSIANTIASPEELRRYVAVTNPELTKILTDEKVRQV